MRLNAVTKAILISLLLVPICRSYVGAYGRDGNGPASNASTPASGVVRGEVHLDGAPLKPTRINMGADPSCANLHTGAVSPDDFVSGPDGKLANVVVFISDGLGNEQFTPPSEPVLMQQKGCMYQPHVVVLQTNQKLRIVNSDTTMHNIHPAPVNNREWNKAQPGGTAIEESFPREEVGIPVKCNVHPWMKSYITVLKHPFYAVTSKDGNFEIPNLRPGEYTLEAWHEKLGVVRQKITISAGAATTADLMFKSSAH